MVMNSKPLQRSTLSREEAAIFGKNPEEIAAAAAGLPKLTRPVNILVMGTIVLTTDLPGATTPPPGQYLEQVSSTLNGQSDAILLIRFDPRSDRVTALSIPRDSRVEIPGLGVGKINSANFAGGASLAARTVSQLLGDISIDRYVRVNVGGFGQLIDALGGVNIYVPKEMKYQDDSQHLYIHLKPGYQHLDGNKAIQFMRFRHDDLGDIGRVQRQQLLFRALLEQKLNLETAVRLPKILAVLQENIDTNMTVEELLALANFTARTNRANVKLLMVPGRFSLPSEYPLSYWIVDENALRRTLANHLDVPLPADYATGNEVQPGLVRVAIQDSQNQPEGMQRATQALLKAGYGQVFAAEESWFQPIPRTQIVAQQGDLTIAQKVRDSLGIGEIVIDATGSIESDVTVRLGADWTSIARTRSAGAALPAAAKSAPNASMRLNGG